MNEEMREIELISDVYELEAGEVVYFDVYQNEWVPVVKS
jgi:hypothetical protein